MTGPASVESDVGYIYMQNNNGTPEISLYSIYAELLFVEEFLVVIGTITDGF